MQDQVLAECGLSTIWSPNKRHTKWVRKVRAVSVELFRRFMKPLVTVGESNYPLWEGFLFRHLVFFILGSTDAFILCQYIKTNGRTTWMLLHLDAS